MNDVSATNGQETLLAEMEERHPVVAGERGIGEEVAGDGKRPALRRDRFEAEDDVVERKVADFPVEQASREDDSDGANDRPDISAKLRCHAT